MAVRASYIYLFWSNFPGDNQEKPAGVVYLYPKKTKTETNLLSTVVARLNDRSRTATFI